MRKLEEIKYVGKNHTYVIEKIKFSPFHTWCVARNNGNDVQMDFYHTFDDAVTHICQMEDFLNGKKFETDDEEIAAYEDFAYHVYGMTLLSYIQNKTIIESLRQAISIDFYEALIVNEDNLYTVYYMSYLNAHEKQRDLPSLEAALAYMALDRKNSFQNGNEYARLNIILNSSEVVRTAEAAENE